MVSSFFAINLIAFCEKIETAREILQKLLPPNDNLHHTNIHQAYGGSYQNAEYLL